MPFAFKFSWPLVKVISLLILMPPTPRLECKVNALSESHETAASTLILPLPEPLVVRIVISLLAKPVTKVSAPILLLLGLPVPALTVKSVGSINHVPVSPFSAFVVIFAPASMRTFAALVSIKPPLPCAALASKVPATLVVPAAMPPIRTILPSWFCTVCASITPVLFTVLAKMLSLAPALMNTKPPSAFTS